MMKALFRMALGGALAAALLSSVKAHDIYTGVHGKNGPLCCGGDDCAATFCRERGDGFEFLTLEQQWIAIPAERITFLPIPGDPPNDDSHHAHLCYRSATDNDRLGAASSNVFEDIFLYCLYSPGFDLKGAPAWPLARSIATVENNGAPPMERSWGTRSWATATLALSIRASRWRTRPKPRCVSIDVSSIREQSKRNCTTTFHFLLV